MGKLLSINSIGYGRNIAKIGLFFNRFINFKLSNNFLKHETKQSIGKISLYCVGGYKIHKGQLSGDMKSYYKEMKQIASKGKFFEHINAYPEKFIWKMLSGLKRLINKKTLFRFNHHLQRYVLS